jgi:hypothetical protein
MTDFRQEFLAFALARDVLRFGEFVTKAGRRTPYFFNAGLFNDGASLRALGRFYAEAWLASGVAADQLFGPAYKGITLAAATAIAPEDVVKPKLRFPFILSGPRIPGINGLALAINQTPVKGAHSSRFQIAQVRVKEAAVAAGHVLGAKQRAVVALQVPHGFF